MKNIIQDHYELISLAIILIIFFLQTIFDKKKDEPKKKKSVHPKNKRPVNPIKSVNYWDNVWDKIDKPKR